LFVIVVVVLSVLVVAAVFAIAIGRAAANEDEAMERLIAERRRELSEEAEREALPARERIIGPRPGPFSSRASAPPSPEGGTAGDDTLAGSRRRRRRRRSTPAA
jgi:hypothetical protein